MSSNQCLKKGRNLVEINKTGWKRESLESKNLIKFFLIAFGWTWLYWSLFIFQIIKLPPEIGTPNVSFRDMLIYIPIVVFSPYGPTFAAFTLTFLNEGKKAARDLWRKSLERNLSTRWLIITFLFQPMLCLLYRLISALNGVQQPQPQWLANPLFVLLPFFASILNGGLSEEIGWRGYALPRLQARFNAVESSLILGFIEGLWHVPLVFWVGDSRYGMSIPVLVLWQMIATFYRTWIFNNTNGSIFAAIMFHAVGNTASWLVPFNIIAISWLPRTKYVQPFLLFVNIVIITGILLIYGPEDMIRKKNST
jgi:membrane protease YdiL (CAAX protease family)